MKKDQKLYDQAYWRYQGMLEAFFSFLKSRPELLEEESAELLTDSFAHIAYKIYNMGYEDAKATHFLNNGKIAN